MATKNKDKLATASVLAFERKLDPSDALFYSGRWNDRRDVWAQWAPIKLREKSVRGTISNRMKGSEPNPAKLDAQIENPNLQTVDVAALPADADTLKSVFTLRVLGNCGRPSACNNADYLQKLMGEVSGYIAANGFGELARRYAINIANGRTLWRNRVVAEEIEVQVRQLDKGVVAQEWTFDALAFSLRDFEVPAIHRDAVQQLAERIESALKGEKYLLLEVIACVRMGAGQEVFPSQELILDKGKDRKSKFLYHVADVAAMHSQKIGNALRTIDDWHEGADEVGPIAVEPYGSVTSLGKAFRQPKAKADFYTLLDNWMLRDQIPVLNDQHYVIANLIRGGVYGEAE